MQGTVGNILRENTRKIEKTSIGYNFQNTRGNKWNQMKTAQKKLPKGING